jgi:3-hydroxyisobutyrate dehydrogenase
MAKQTVAVLGCGTMGAPMALNLLRAGFDVRVWNRTKAKAEALAADGAVVAASPAQAAAGASVVLTMLSDGGAVEEAIAGVLETLDDGALWIQSTTVGVEAADRLAELARAAGVGYLDAPVLGTKRPAELGELVVLASGPEELVGRAAPVLDAIGKSTIRVGEAGAGSRLKLVVNLWVLAVTEAVGESVALAEGLGVDPQLFLDAMKGGLIDSPYLHLKGAAILERRLEPSMRLGLAVKDARLIREAAEGAGVEAGLPGVIERQMTRAVELGHGDEDMAATYFASAPG